MESHGSVRTRRRTEAVAIEQARAARRLVRLSPSATGFVRLLLRILEFAFLPAALILASCLVFAMYGGPLEAWRLLGIGLVGLVGHLLVAALLVELFDPGFAESGLLEMPRTHARYLYFWLRITNWIATIFGPAVYVAGRAGLPRELLIICESACKAGVLVTCGALLLRRESLMALFPRADSAIGKAVSRVSRALYPVLATYLLALLAIWTVGYLNLFNSIARSTVIVIGVLTVYLVLSRAATWFSSKPLRGWLETRLTREVEDESKAEARARVRALGDSFNQLLQIALFFGLTVSAVLSLQVDWQSFRELLTFEIIPGTAGGPDQIAIPGIQLLDVCYATLTLFLFLFLARLSREVVLRFLLGRTELEISTRESIGTGVFAAAVVFGVYLTSQRLGFDLELLKWMAGALGLGLGFGLQNILNNFFSGLILLMEKPVAINDLIEVDDTTGFVHRIRTRSTTLRTRDNISVIIPNSDLISDKVINWSHRDVRTRIAIDVGVAYGSDVSLVRKLLLKVASDHGLTLKKPAPEVLFQDFGESSLDFRLHVWTRDLHAVPRIGSDLRFAVDASFRNHNIEIPFPQRDLHVKELPAPAPPADPAEAGKEE